MRHTFKILKSLRWVFFIYFFSVSSGGTCIHVWANIRAVFLWLKFLWPSKTAAGDRMTGMYFGTLGPERITKVK